MRELTEDEKAAVIDCLFATIAVLQESQQTHYSAVVNQRVRRLLSAADKLYDAWEAAHEATIR